MTINCNNFEEYILDYLEGNLNPIVTAELMAFIAENPEYEQLLQLKEYKIPGAGKDEFAGKSELKKNFTDIGKINDQNFEEFCIAASEGLLDKTNSRRLNEFIGNDIRKTNIFELFKSLKLTPDLSVFYPDKRRIKKHEGGMFRKNYLYYGLAIAAAITLLLVLTVNKSSVTDQVVSPIISENKTSSETAKQVPQNLQRDILTVNNTGNSAREKVTSRIAETGSQVEKAEDHMDSEHTSHSFYMEVLEPVSGKISGSATSFSSIELPLPEPRGVEQTPVRKPDRTKLVDSDNLLTEIFSRLNLWKTAETALSGFNYLTEAQVTLSKTTDENGKVTGVSLNTESYTIEGKIR